MFRLDLIDNDLRYPLMDAPSITEGLSFASRYLSCGEEPEVQVEVIHAPTNTLAATISKARWDVTYHNGFYPAWTSKEAA